MNKWISLLLLSFSIVIFYIPNQTFACSCMMPESPQEELKKASYVFIASVEDIYQKTFIEEIFEWETYSHTKNQVSFRNITDIKWTYNHNNIIWTSESSASCGVNFQKWKTYIVYAYENGKKEIWVSLCSRTNLTENADEDLEAFKDIINKDTNTELIVPDPKQKIDILSVIYTLFWVLLSVVLIYKLWKTKNT